MSNIVDQKQLTTFSNISIFADFAGMDRRSLFEAEAEVEAEGKKPSAFGQRLKQKILKFKILEIFSSILQKKQNWESKKN